MNIKTFEKYIKYTKKPYGDLLKRAEKTLKVQYNNEIVVVSDNNDKEMVLYFEDSSIYENNLDCGLIQSTYNYAK